MVMTDVVQLCPRCHRRIAVVRDPSAAGVSDQTDPWRFVEHTAGGVRPRRWRRERLCRASGRTRWAAAHGW
jgi:hypothetical protein